jgi:hypothetical protein
MNLTSDYSRIKIPGRQEDIRDGILRAFWICPLPGGKWQLLLEKPETGHSEGTLEAWGYRTLLPRLEKTSPKLFYTLTQEVSPLGWGFPRGLIQKTKNLAQLTGGKKDPWPRILPLIETRFNLAPGNYVFIYGPSYEQHGELATEIFNIGISE